MPGFAALPDSIVDKILHHTIYKPENTYFNQLYRSLGCEPPAPTVENDYIKASQTLRAMACVNKKFKKISDNSKNWRNIVDAAAFGASDIKPLDSNYTIKLRLISTLIEQFKRKHAEFYYTERGAQIGSSFHLYPITGSLDGRVSGGNPLNNAMANLLVMGLRVLTFPISLPGAAVGAAAGLVGDGIKAIQKKPRIVALENIDPVANPHFESVVYGPQPTLENFMQKHSIKMR